MSATVIILLVAGFLIALVVFRERDPVGKVKLIVKGEPRWALFTDAALEEALDRAKKNPEDLTE